MPTVISTGPNAAVLSTRPERRVPPRQTLLRRSREPVIEVGLINNMPDPALESTERQFSGLLNAAAGSVRVRVTCYSLPGISRTEKGKQYVSGRYASIDDLWDRHLDALIITGTEPRTSDLRDEPFWGALGEVLDWAEDNAVSTILSCLAAHAAVLHIDGIERHALADKCFGLFDQEIVADHPAVAGLASRLQVPHSRWNEVHNDALESCGYQVLTRSADAGVDLFVRQRKASFLFFQGHPEYEPGVLLKEYKRDVGRFLRAERKNYPNIPKGCFDPATTARLARFRERALAQPGEELLAEFPAVSETNAPIEAQASSAVIIYRNWLSKVIQGKAETRLSHF
jgi:homoserine O-succinyltransferase